MGGLPRFPQFPIRIDPVLIGKIRYIGRENCRSANKEIELLIRNRIKEWEAQNFDITEEDLKNLDD